jgi:hypothetical protein
MIPQCSFCENLLGPRSCRAYPTGIPDAIWENEVDHKQPYEDDNGVRFTPRGGK